MAARRASDPGTGSIPETPQSGHMNNGRSLALGARVTEFDSRMPNQFFLDTRSKQTVSSFNLR